MPKMTDVTCECGKVFQARVADVNRGWGKNCGKRCAAKDREKQIRFIKEIKGENVKSKRKRRTYKRYP